MRKGGAVAVWLQRCTRANVSFESLSLREPNEDANLKMLDEDSDGHQIGLIADRAAEILEAKYELSRRIDYTEGSLIDAVVAVRLGLSDMGLGDQPLDDTGVEIAAEEVATAILRGLKPPRSQTT
jgi:hypothetical protein